jgi:histidyl-tRNA synthetase
MFSDILKELKINIEIQLNNRKLLSSIIESVQINDKKWSDVREATKKYHENV